MNTIDGFDLQCEQAPVPSSLASELVGFWESILQSPFSWLMEVLLGSEVSDNEDFLYIIRKDGCIASTCRLTISRLDSRLGLIGEVATSEDFRGKGLARRLCSRALNDFRSRNGKALFLGTNNPIAASLYANLGWKQLLGSNVMLNAESAKEPNEYLDDYFSLGRGQKVHILPGSARHRVPIVPLIITPHDFVIMDANTSLRSTKYANQPSCEGLYLKYAEITKNGAWFVAERADCAVVGLSSAKETEDGAYCIEAFVHPYYNEKYLGILYEEAIRWARDHGVSSVYTTCSKQDSSKRNALNRLSSSISLPVRDVL